jgi:hypothetical protein
LASLRRAPRESDLDPWVTLTEQAGRPVAPLP